MSNHRIPWIRFYPADWLKDPALSACSLAAQGAWMRLLCHMHEATPRGYLCDGNGQPFSDKQLARLIGCAPQTVRKIVAELVDLGVVSVSKGDHQTQGILFSRRMVRDDRKLQQDIENGRKGGNPNVISGVNPPVNGGVGKRLRLDSDTDTDTESKTEAAPLTDQNLSQSSSSSAPSAQPPVRTSTGEPVTWAEAAEAMKGLKVSRIGDAIESAKGNNFSPPAVLALIDVLRSVGPKLCKSPAGALYDRLATPGAAEWFATENWPWSDKSRRASTPAAEAVRPTDDMDAWFNTIVEDKAIVQLELTFGPTLNEMTPSELAQLFEKSLASGQRTLIDLAKEGQQKLNGGTGIDDQKFRVIALKVLRINATNRT